MANDQSQLIGHRRNDSSNLHSVECVVVGSNYTISSSLSISTDDSSSSSNQQAIQRRRSGRGPVGTTNRQAAQEDAQNLAVKDEIRRGVLFAIDTAKEMAEAAQSGDLMELSNAGFVLSHRLNELWRYRKHRESNWGDLINLVQGALVREKFEMFSEQQCRHIADILAHHLRPWPVEDDDLRISVQILRRAKFDPWKGLSKSEG